MTSEFQLDCLVGYLYAHKRAFYACALTHEGTIRRSNNHIREVGPVYATPSSGSLSLYKVREINEPKP